MHSPYCNALLCRRKPAADVHNHGHRTVGREFDVFAFARNRNEDARRLAQHGVDGHARGPTAPYPNVDL